MKSTHRTALAVFLAVGFMASMAAWMRSSASTAEAKAAPPPLTRMEYLTTIGCDANAFSTVTWIGVMNGQPQVGMNTEALVCALGAPDDVRIITTSHGETVFRAYHREGRRPMMVETFNGTVTVIAD